MSIYDEIKRALQDIVAPEIQALKVEIHRLDEKIDSRFREVEAKFAALDEKSAARFGEMRTELAALDEKFTARFGQVEARFGEVKVELAALNAKIEELRYEVRTVLEIRERLAAVEAKLGITRSS